MPISSTSETSKLQNTKIELDSPKADSSYGDCCESPYSSSGESSDDLRQPPQQTRHLTPNGGIDFNGGVYNGYISESGVPDGYGILTRTNGDKYDGEWQEGKPIGVGIFQKNDKSYDTHIPSTSNTSENRIVDIQEKHIVSDDESFSRPNKKQRTEDVSDTNDTRTEKVVTDTITLDDLKAASADELNEIVTTRFSELSEKQLYFLLTNETLSEDEQEFISVAIWSWVHILNYDQESIDTICQGEKINVIPSAKDEDSSIIFNDTEFRDQWSRYCCDSPYSVHVLSEEMLGAAINDPSLTGSDLGFILDNFIVTDADTYHNENYDIVFQDKTWRDEVFKSSKLDYHAISFLGQFKYENPEDYAANCCEDEKDFVSKEVATVAFETLMNLDHKDAVKNIKNLWETPEITVHLDSDQLDRLNTVYLEQVVNPGSRANEELFSELDSFIDEE